MLKIIKNTSMLLALSLSANSFAGVITDTITQNVKLSTWQSYSFTHNILNDGFILGSALSGNLSINIYDDKDLLGELAVIKVENFDFDTGGSWGAALFSAMPGWASDLEVNALFALNSDGLLDVKITSLFGDFYVGDSVLTVTTSDVAAVSEPATLALLGLGLLGLGFSRKKLSV